MGTRFLTSEPLWNEIRSRVRRAKRARVAVAYFGTGGSKLLPLRRGHKLVVDLSIAAVSQGVTNPHEILTLQRRGVEVFTRGTLHSKFFLFDETLIVGSSNVSTNSLERLDEAGMLTTDVSAVRRARTFFDEKLCIEPVRSDYLKLCIKRYRPPSFKAASEECKASDKKQSRAVEAKLWLIAGLQYVDYPEEEQKQIEAAEDRARERKSASGSTVVDGTRYVRRLRYFDHIREGDWVLKCVKDSNGRTDVGPPAQHLGIEEYTSPEGKPRFLLLDEEPENGQALSLADFQRRVKRIMPRLAAPRKRMQTQPITDDAVADSILSVWTPSGRVSKRMRRGR